MRLLRSFLFVNHLNKQLKDINMTVVSTILLFNWKKNDPFKLTYYLFLKTLTINKSAKSSLIKGSTGTLVWYFLRKDFLLNDSLDGHREVEFSRNHYVFGCLLNCVKGGCARVE